jgi:hypothetical protein
VAKSYSLTRDSVDKLARVADEHTHATRPDNYYSLRRAGNTAGPAGIVVRTPAGGIPGATYDSSSNEITCGKANCKIYHAKAEIDRDGLKIIVLIELEQELEVWNMVTSEVGGDSNVQVKNMYDTWFVDVEDCGTD